MTVKCLKLKNSKKKGFPKMLFLKNMDSQLIMEVLIHIPQTHPSAKIALFVCLSIGKVVFTNICKFNIV